MIRATLEQIQQIRAHAENTYPEECCGLLIGKIEGENKILIEVRATENSWNAEAAGVFCP